MKPSDDCPARDNGGSADDVVGGNATWRLKMDTACRGADAVRR